MSDRSPIGSMKWNEMYSSINFPNSQMIPLSMADMEFVTAPEIVEGYINFLENKPVLGYTEPTSNYYLAVINWFSRRHDFHIEKDWIINTQGVVSGVYAAVRAFTKKDEGIILLTPSYYPFFAAIADNKRTKVEIALTDCGDHYELDFELFEKVCEDENNKLLILCSPHNPVGKVWSKLELEKIAEICLKNNVVIVSDEIHNDLIMPGYKHYMTANLSKEVSNITITCTSPSKTFNLAGLSNSNFIIENPKMREQFKNAVKQVNAHLINLFGLLGCQLAYEKGEPWLESLLEVIYSNSNTMKQMLENDTKVRVYPLEGTYLQWLDFRNYNKNAEDLEKFMHEEAHIFFDEGYLFGTGGSGFERINLALPEKELINQISKLTTSLKNI